MRKLTDEIDPTNYWDHDDRLEARSLAKALVDEPRDEPQGEPIYVVATAEETDTVYWHDGRVWTDRGETVLRDACWELLGDAASAERVNKVIRHTRQLTRQPRASIFDLPAHKLVVGNGILDLRTGGFSQSFGRPGTLTALDVPYNPEAYPERFNQFLFDVLPSDDVSVMWEVIGYCLYRGYPFQRAFMLLGDGANGKSTLLAVLRNLLGPKNVSAVELQQFDRSENRFAAAKLEGKLANIAPDISDDDLDRTGTFKALTGGDLITAERKYEDPFEFENAATLIFSANQKPPAPDDTHAYRRRWTHFEFPNTFSGEAAVPQEELLAEFREEQPGILALAVEAFQQLWARGEFQSTTFDAERGAEADAVASNPLYQFVTDEMEPEPGATLRKKDAYQAYRRWADDRGHTKQGDETFKRVVNDVHGPAAGSDPEDGRFAVWFDLGLVDDDASPDPRPDGQVPLTEGSGG